MKWYNFSFQSGMKWLYTFVLLGVTVGWARYLVETVKGAIAAPAQANIIEVAGVATLLGVLLTLNVNVNQHWFRKAMPEDKP